MKNRNMWFSIWQPLPRFGFSEEKLRGAARRGGKMRHAAAHHAAGKERIEKGDRWKRATTVRRWLRRGGKVGVWKRRKTKAKRTAGYRTCRERRRGESDDAKDAREGEEKGGKCEGPSADSLLALSACTQCTPPAPDVTAVSLSLFLLSICFLFFLLHIAAAVAPWTFRVYLSDIPVATW